MEFRISPASGLPIYQQLVEQVRSGVARGKLAADEKLPSVRELSQSLVINPNTVARAYTELERDGVLYTRPGMGVFVAAKSAPLTKKVRRERLLPLVDQLLVEAVEMGCSLAELSKLISERSTVFEWSGASEPSNASGGKRK